MAPAKKRSTLRARAAATKSTSRPTDPPPTAASNVTMAPTDLSALKLRKQDKRNLKHAALMHRVRDASIQKSASKKRRRPGKKLQAAESLGGLADALPDVEDEDEEWEGLSDSAGEMDIGTQKKARRRRLGDEGKIKMHSLKHRPGAMKRKQALEQREQERFGRNLAQLAGNERNGKVAGTGEEEGSGQAQKWAALRAFIGGTMEKDRAFGKG